MKKLNKLDDSKKFSILKKGIGIEKDRDQKVSKQVRDEKSTETSQRWNSRVIRE